MSENELRDAEEFDSDSEHDSQVDHDDDLPDGMDASGFAGPSKIVKPLTKEALAAFKAEQDRAGVIYISRIPPGMRPTKVRHIMSGYGEIGRVYLQQEGTFSACHLMITLIQHIDRRKEGISPQEIHIHKESALRRRLGRIQGQKSRSQCCRNAECTNDRRQKRHAMAG